MNTLTDIHYWLAISYLEGIGPIGIQSALKQFGNLKNLFSTSIQDLQTAGFNNKQIRSLKNPKWHAVEKDLEWCEKMNCQLISIADKRYPTLLRQISDPPLLLFVRGDASLLSKAQLAIVGSRNPTIIGKELAEQFAYYLAQTELVITSGLALGIDAESHRGALHAQGKTIAVCGSGLQHIYPYSNNKLAEDIICNGALISEFPPYTMPKAKYFPMRNRIISGLSLGVLVIEAALRSGSLITARCAAEQGREVFAVPGSIHNPLSRGCHQLIRQGAKLVETSNDILEELGSLNKIVMQKIPKTFDLIGKHKDLLAQIGYEITTLDAIIIRSGLTAAEVCSILLLLELEGFITAIPGGYVRNP